MSKRNVPPEGDRPVARGLRNTLYVVGVVVGLVAALIACGMWALNQAALNAIGVGGVAVTVIALAAAVHIFNQQSIDQAKQAQEAQVEASLTEADLAPDKAEQAAIEQADDEPDPAKAAQEEQTETQEGAGRTVESGGKTWRIYSQQHVPLYVVADLVEAWRDDPDPSMKDGNWVVRNLIGAARPVGQGNHPWLIVFRNRADERRSYRLYRGGRGNQGRNVRNVTRIS